MGARHQAVFVGTYPRNPQERAGTRVLFQGTTRGCFDEFQTSENAIDRIVASCNGDLHGALRALLLVNEQLEAELQQLYAAVALGGPFETRQRGAALNLGGCRFRLPRLFLPSAGGLAPVHRDCVGSWRAASQGIDQISRPSTFSLKVLTSSGTLSMCGLIASACGRRQARACCRRGPA